MTQPRDPAFTARRSPHADWCHLCGGYFAEVVEVWYSRLAEQRPADRTMYLRICGHCIERLQLVNDMDIQIGK